MTETVESPLQTAADLAGDRITDVFSVLANETRLAIMLALWEAYQPFPEGTWNPTTGHAVPFSELRNRVGMRDSGQFNYHLDKLEDHFVDRTPDGYQLTPAGHDLVRTVIGGAGFEDPEFDPEPIDLACQYCGAETALTYQNQRVYHVCTACEGSFELGEGHPDKSLSAWSAEPNILKDRSTADIFAALNTRNHHEFAMRAAGVCSECSGRVEGTLDVCEDHDPSEADVCPNCDRRPMAVVRYVCGACKHSSVTSLNFLGLIHPAMAAFAWRHGTELGYRRRDLDIARWINALDSEHELLSVDPPRVRVTRRYDGDVIRMTFDETLQVVDVEE